MKKSSLMNNLAKGAVLTAGVLLSAKVVSKSMFPYRLDGKVALITGGSRGLGIILARKLSEAGAKVVICGRSEEDLQEAAKDLAFRGNGFLAIPCDITDKQQIKQMVQRIKLEMGSVDILINNAGIIQVGPMETMNEADFESAFKTHFWGPFYVMKQVLPDMMERKKGRIVNIVSIGGKVSFPHLLPYNTSKYALSGFSEGLSPELKKYGIKITTVYPGLMRTGSPRNIDVKGQHEKEYAWFKIMDSLPGLSMNAEQAAIEIIEAMKRGRRILTLTTPAKLAIAAHGIAPGFTLSLFNLINFFLPRKKNGTKTKKGYESESAASESILTKKTDEAAEEHLEK